MAERVRRTTLLTVCAVVQAVAVVVMHHVFVTTATGRYVDTVAITGSTIGFGHIAELVYGVLELVSVASVVIAFVVVVVVALLRRRAALALGVGALLVGANLTTQVLKQLVFDRPDLPSALPGGVTGGLFNTLPSGHATVALSVAVAVVLVVPARMRGGFALLAVAYAALTGVGTLSARWHRPSDVIAACLVVGACAAAVGAFATFRSTRMASPRRSRALPLLGFAAVVLLAIGVLTLLATAQTPPDQMHRLGLFAGYAGGAAAITGTCAAVMAGVLAIAPWVVPEGRAPRRWEPAGDRDAYGGELATAGWRR
ncbi:MAG: phosphatase PAP2 family protein [Streptosporangiales bacterium]|nr:phosphatase PAP2 family protein [Streptosporangiales bacterium]